MRKWLPFIGADLKEQGQRNALFVSLSQCATTFSLNFVDILLPFYIFKISPYSERDTLFWVGAIIGTGGLFTAVASLIWGSLTHYLSPKMLFQRGQIAHAVFYVLMAFTTSLNVLFVLRLLQGVFGGVSTIGLILISSSSAREKVPSNVGMFQSFLTLGQLAGPPLGTLAAAAFGYRSSFICGATLLVASFLFCQFNVIDVPKLPRHRRPGKGQPFDRHDTLSANLVGDAKGRNIETRSGLMGWASVLASWRLHEGIFVGWVVCVIVQIHLSFLPSILPKVLETFNVHGANALRLAGVVVTCYTVATMAGTFAWTRLSKRIGLLKLATFLLIMGIIFQTMLSFTPGVFYFTIVRMLHTGFIIAVIPLVISIFATQRKGFVIGLLNASRYCGNAAGPMLAASMMAIYGFNGLCLLVSVLTVLALIAFRLVFRSEKAVTEHMEVPMSNG